jgi:hypothetical protein
VTSLEVASPLPIGLDPLIAEARHRTRRRRLLLAALALLVGAGALGTWLFTREPDARVDAGRRPVLGSTRFTAFSGTGWGAARPTRIYNGGDCLGTVTNIRWKNWGSPTAVGVGQTCDLAPATSNVGWYAVRIQLRATDLGRCDPSGPVAYRELYVRRPPASKGGHPSAWGRWSTGGRTNLCHRY